MPFGWQPASLFSLRPKRTKRFKWLDDLLKRLDLSELPMTLLRRDRQSKLHLQNRLDSIRKDRSQAEVTLEHASAKNRHRAEQDALTVTRRDFAAAVRAEAHVEAAAKALRSSSGLGRVTRFIKYWFARRRWDRRAPIPTDRLAIQGSNQRAKVGKSAQAAAWTRSRIPCFERHSRRKAESEGTTASSATRPNELQELLRF